MVDGNAIGLGYDAVHGTVFSPDGRISLPIAKDGEKPESASMATASDALTMQAHRFSVRTASSRLLLRNGDKWCVVKDGAPDMQYDAVSRPLVFTDRPIRLYAHRNDSWRSARCAIGKTSTNLSPKLHFRPGFGAHVFTRLETTKRCMVGRRKAKLQPHFEGCSAYQRRRQPVCLCSNVGTPENSTFVVDNGVAGKTLVPGVPHGDDIGGSIVLFGHVGQ